MKILDVLLLLAAWFAWGVWFFLDHMGDKWRKGRWYDWVICGPLFVLVQIYAWFRWRK